MKTTRAALLGALAVLCMMYGCDRARSAPMAAAQEAPPSARVGPEGDEYEYPALYDRMGGGAVIDRVAADFVQRLGADRRITNPKVRARLARADRQNLRTQMAAVLCDAADGPCVYEGRDMQDVHRGMGISDRDFDAAMEDLSAALDAARVPPQERDELTAVVGDMRGDIVEVRTVLDR
jgi:hemoglobin